MFLWIDYIILQSLDEHAAATSAISDQLHDLVTALRNTSRLLFHNEQTSGGTDPDPDAEYEAFVTIARRITTNIHEAQESTFIVNH
jgi:hypothetical protein